MLSLPSPCALMSGPLAPVLLSLSSPPPQEATTSVSARTATITDAASRALRLADSLFIRTPLLGCADDTGVFAFPGERHRSVPQRLGVLEAGVCILAHDHQLAAAVELYDKACGGACIQAVADSSGSAAVIVAAGGARFDDLNALGADRHDRPRAHGHRFAHGSRDVVLRPERQPRDPRLDRFDLQLEQVRDAHEGGHEAGPRLVVDL